MNDLYEEILIARKSNPMDRAIIIALFLLCGVCLFLGLFIHYLLLIPAIALGILSWYKAGRLHVEYEYAYTNGQLDIDAIYNAAKRKHLATYEADQLLCLAPAGSVALANYPRDVKALDYTSGQENIPYYVAIYQTDRGQMRLHLELTDTAANNMRMHNPRNVFLR